MNDKRIIVIYSDDKIQYFKNFVSKAMPDAQENNKEMVSLSTVSKIIEAFEGDKSE